MKVNTFKDLNHLYDELSSYYIKRINQTPNLTLGLATGSTPVPLYKRLIQGYKRHEVSFKNVTTYNLDEYIGIPKDHEQSYHTFMHHEFFDHIDIDLSKVHIPETSNQELLQSVKKYQDTFKSLKIDIQLLGLGSNGHIGFNEPKTPFDSITHIINLDQKTIADNARFFNHIEEVPKQALTMGIAEIMKAKEIIVVATGHQKADAVWRMIKGEITEDVPASVLQKHPNVTVYLDRFAAEKL